MIEPMQPDLAEAVRPASCRAASRTSGRACPMPSLRCTRHIGGSTTCDRVTVTRQCFRGRPRTCRSPRVSRDAECTQNSVHGRPCFAHDLHACVEHCCRLQADAMRGCDLDQIARCANGAARSCHWRRLSGAQAAAAASQPHHMRIARIDPRLAGSPAGANRPAEAARS